MKKTLPKRTKSKAKRKAPPALTAGRKRDTRFQPGQSGNAEAQFKPGISGNPGGRPPGARSRLSEAFLHAVFEAWTEHGAASLAWLVANDKARFVEMVASLMPKNIKAEIEETKAVYVVSDHPLTAKEWEAKFCDPDGKPN